MRVDRFFSPIIIILALAAFFLLFGLADRPFWQDEAETAGLAKNVLHYGVPRAYDGLNIISQEQGREFGADFLWRWSPWLQIYVTAAAFRLGGLNTFAGRLPHALMGLACVFLVYRLVRRNFDDRTWALLRRGSSHRLRALPPVCPPMPLLQLRGFIHLNEPLCL